MKLVFLFVALWFHVPVETWDIQLICPAGDFTRGSNVTLLCTLLKQSFPSKCTVSHAEKLDFIVTSSTGSVSVPCTVTGFTSCNSVPADQLGCACVNDSAAYTFQYKFTVDGIHEGTWKCNVPCRDGPFSALTLDTKNCSDKKINEPPTTVPSTTPNSAATPAKSPRTADFTLICPADGYFVKGQACTLRCEVNGTALDAERCASLNSVRLELLESDKTPSLLAYSSYPACDTNWTGGARCASKDLMSNIYAYEFLFTADINEEEKFLKCWSDCIPSGGAGATISVTTTTCAIKFKKDYRWFGFVALIAFVPISVPLPWPGYLIYVLICWCVCKRYRSTGLWHPHYMCGKRTNDVYFSACFVTNDGRAVLIWSKSPATGRFVCYGTETTSGTNRNNVSAETGAMNNGNNHTSQKEKTKHTGTDGSPRKSRQPEAPVELTTVRTSSPPQAATVPGDNQASGTPHGDHQASGTPRLRPLPEPSRMTSVERDSTAETSNMVDKHTKLPPIGKPYNHP